MIATGRTFGTVEMRVTAFRVVTVGFERIDRAGGGAGRRASDAGIGGGRGQGKQARQGQRAPHRSPEAHMRMAHQMDRRGEALSAFHGPAHERLPGWAGEGEKRAGFKLPCEGADHPRRPAVQRIGRVLGEFRLSGDVIPEAGLVGRDQRDCLAILMQQPRHEEPVRGQRRGEGGDHRGRLTHCAVSRAARSSGSSSPPHVR